MNSTENKKTDFDAAQLKALQGGFSITPFSGFTLAEIDSGVELHFTNLVDVHHYIDACDLSEAEIRKHYNFTTDSDIAE